MIIIRPIAQKDLESFIQMAFTAGIGMTSMPKNRDLLEKRVKESIEAFHAQVSSPGNENYLFVLEDLETGSIGGTCGITAMTGKNSPLSFYRKKKLEQHKCPDSIIKIVPTLHVVHYKDYWSEIGSLYLTAKFRHSGLGRLLSLSRFLFIAQYPEKFDSMIFAEMRGYLDQNQISSFWEGIGQHFVETKFETLMHLRDEGIVDLSEALPSHPIYIELLPKNVQESIGKVHDETNAALKMLIDEGFSLSYDIDVCDGGPKIEIETKKIRSIKESKTVAIATFTDEPLVTAPFIISNNKLNFKACLSPIQITSNGEAVIPYETAKALELDIGDIIRYVSPYNQVKT